VDPFLLTHKVRHELYDIGPRLSPISIRDQMTRAYVLVVRAIRRQIIGPDKPLLVVGAGAAGATAAMIAADRGVQTMVIERGDGTFSLQLGCHTRWIDPIVYDWPVDHWTKGEFPWRGIALPLHWEAGTSAAVAGMWEKLFTDELSINPYLTLVSKAELETPTALGNDKTKKVIEVYYRNVETNAREGPFQFAMILSCIGAGPDKVVLDNYRGESFWSDDSYADANMGLPGYTSPRVLISGSGDGALQDFLRIVTKKNSAKQIYQSVPVRLQSEAISLISSTEDQYQRAFTWSGNADGTYKPDDCDIQATLHDEYTNVVNQFLIKYKSELTTTVDPILKGAPERLMITLAFECSHFSHCYPLNHFLALLLARYIEERAKKKRVLSPHTRVVRVSGSDGKHVCDKDKRSDCEEVLHEASFIPADCDTPRGGSIDAANPLQNGPFNVIIVRHGIDWNEPLFGELPQTNKRHMLPYYLGWES
jgi:NAD(P)-binding Rossmann-like domain